MRSKSLLALVVMTATGLVMSACGGSNGNSGSSGSGSNSANGSDAAGGSSTSGTLEIFSWWTSGSEDAALQALISGYKKAHPGVEVTNGAVAGGGGGNASQILQTRIQGGTPPDTFQTHPAESLKIYLDADALADLTSVYTENKLADVMPKEMIDAQSKDGKIYGISVGAHRGNVLWYSKPVLEKAGVKIPGDSYSPESFLADLEKVKASGSIPLCLGGKDTFAVAQLFENTLLGIVGPAKWSELTTGKTPWSEADVTKAAETFAKVVSYADSDAAALTWDQAIKKLGDGQCAFNSMGDWAYGELAKNGKTEGTDFGYTAHPGSSGSFVLVVDTFAVAKNAKDMQQAMDWATVIGQSDTQLEFNKLKGSTPIRTDVDVSSLPTYQQNAAKSYRNDKLVWSIAHGQATPPAFQQSFFDAITQFVTAKDSAAFVQALASAG